MSDTPLLHVHGQPGQHDDVYLVGNREGLLALREAIDEVLTAPGGDISGAFEAMVQDGEAFTGHVILIDEGWQSTRWNRALRPYTANYAKDNRDEKVMPWEHRKRV